MTRRVQRLKNFDVTLEISSDDFIRTPREVQRNWLLNRSMKEFCDNLQTLDTQARDYVRGRDVQGFTDRTQARLDDQAIMEDWQKPVMQAMANAVTGSGGDILDIGFGRGIASTMIQEAGVRSHTVVECNESVIERFEQWRRQYPGRDVRLIRGKWQDVTDSFDVYDGIFFHTYPLNQQEYYDLVVQSVTFGEHFFPTAAAHLRPGGSFSYLTLESDSLSREHQRLLFRYFSSFSLSRVEVLNIPEDSQDVHWANSMVIVRAEK